MDHSRLARNRWLALGRAGLDLYADPPGTRVEDTAAFFPALGGSAANIAVGIAKLGGSAAMLTTLSSDAVGGFVLKELRRYGVATDHVSVVGGAARTSLAVAATRNDDTQSVIYRNGAADFQLSHAEVEAVPFDRFGALVVTGTSLAAEPSREAAFFAADRASAAGAAVIFDIDYRAYSWENGSVAAEVCRRFAALSDVIVGNDEEFAVVADGGDGPALARAMAAHAEAVVYKMGARGSRAFVGDKVIDTGVFPVTPLKPTGAGDAFLAGLLTSLALGFDWSASIRRGAAVAAIVVTKVGCAPATPDAEELRSYLARHS
ncbi:MAG: permease [Hyphomicrobiales bacterium]|nr:permease [Hyphomicrobiales bacterium]MDE2017365.1 permease [Hyphomicrobiales bacterium]